MGECRAAGRCNFLLVPSPKSFCLRVVPLATWLQQNEGIHHPAVNGRPEHVSVVETKEDKLENEHYIIRIS